MYASLSYADAYFDQRLHVSAWLESPVEDRNRALIMATRSIDKLNYLGTRFLDSQEGEFPREGVDVPTAIMDACCEIALALLEGIDPQEEYNSVHLSSQRYSNAASTYNADLIPEHKMAQIASAYAWQLLKPFLRENWGIRINRVG